MPAATARHMGVILLAGPTLPCLLPLPDTWEWVKHVFSHDMKCYVACWICCGLVFHRQPRRLVCKNDMYEFMVLPKTPFEFHANLMCVVTCTGTIEYSGAYAKHMFLLNEHCWFVNMTCWLIVGVSVGVGLQLGFSGMCLGWL
jgi:hypothetical protein